MVISRPFFTNNISACRMKNWFFQALRFFALNNYSSNILDFALGWHLLPAVSLVYCKWSSQNYSSAAGETHMQTHSSRCGNSALSLNGYSIRWHHVCAEIWLNNTSKLTSVSFSIWWPAESSDVRISHGERETLFFVSPLWRQKNKVWCGIRPSRSVSTSCCLIWD